MAANIGMKVYEERLRSSAGWQALHGKQVAYNCGLLCVHVGLLLGKVSHDFGLLESQVARNNRPQHPKVAHSSLKVAPNHRLLAFQVLGFGSIPMKAAWNSLCQGPHIYPLAWLSRYLGASLAHFWPTVGPSGLVF